MLSITKADKLAVQLKEKLQAIAVDALAIQTGFVRRKPRKITPPEFLLSFFITVLTGGHSLAAFAATIGLVHGVRISKQAVDKRIKEPVLKFLEFVLAGTLSNIIKSQRQPVYSAIFTPFKHILVQDSTHITLDSKLAEHFPGSRNHTTKPTAILKIQTVIDLLREQFCHFEITAFTQNDQKASTLILQIVKRGDLIIRDPGYFLLDGIKEIQLKRAYFLSRLKYGIALYQVDGETTFDLLAALQKHGRLDVEVCLGAKEKLRARLVAIPLPKKVAAERRRKARANRDRRLNPSREHLALLSWDIFVINVDRTLLTAEQIAEIYDLRWRIEIIFKSWKSHFSTTNVPKASAIRVKSYIYATLIFITMFQTYFFVRLYHEIYRKNNKQLSLLKLSRFFKDQIWAMVLFFHTSANVTIEKVEEQIFYHCVYESRKNRLNYVQQIVSLG